MSYRVFNLVIIPFYTLLFNALLFDERYVKNIRIFITATIVTYVAIFLVRYLQIWITGTIKAYLAKDKAHLKPLLTNVLFQIGVNTIILSLLITFYIGISYIKYEANWYKLILMLLFSNVINISAILIYDGINSFSKWKKTLIETEQLRKTYMISQLWILKSQISSNFLFKNLDTLSILLSKDPSNAENYIEQMSKVYQYFLSKNEEPLVPIANEVQFLQSYYYILKAWHGKTIQLVINIDENSKAMLPPFTLQTIFEGAINKTKQHSNSSLYFEITNIGNELLEIHMQYKNLIIEKEDEQDALLANIIDKFKLLTKQPVRINDDTNNKILWLPLLSNNEVIAL